MSIKVKDEEFGKYLTNIMSISRKILRLLFDLELAQNNELYERIEKIKKNPQPEKDLFFFENLLDFKSLINLLRIYNKKNKLNVLIDKESKNIVDEKKIFGNLLEDLVELRNDLWHNSVNYKNPKKYNLIILNIKKSYEMFKNNKLINKPELFINSIKYLDISLEFFEKI